MNMKRILLILTVIICATTAVAQEFSADNDTTVSALQRARYGFCNRQALIESQPEYTKAMQTLKNLRAQYEQEAQYNETNFRRQYSEYLNGQKDFPKAILLKRQRDLQDAMERGIAFRTQADSLLRDAERDLLLPIERKVDAAIAAVGAERDYDYVIDTSMHTMLYLNPALNEDITLFVEEKLR